MNARNAGAVKTAGERLEQIEAWSRRTFIAAVVSAACLAIVASAVLYLEYQYVRMSRALEEARAAMAGESAGSGPRSGGLTFDPRRAIGDLKAGLSGRAPAPAAPRAELPAPDADGHPLRAGDVVMHVNDHGSSTVAVRCRGESIGVANRTRSVLTGGTRPTQVPGVVLYEAELREGEHAGKLVTCAPAALRFMEHGR